MFRRRRSYRFFGRSQNPYKDSTVGEVRIAAAVATIFCRTDARALVGHGDLSGGLEVADHQFALGIEIGADMVGDLPGVVADTDAAVEAGGAQPQRLAAGADGRRLPEVYVVAPVRASPDRLFESQMLLPAVAK